MKITCISDTHYRHRYLQKSDFESTDLLIHAGDFTGNGNKSQTIEFLQWFESLEVEHKVLIAGNHDFFACSESFEDILLSIAPSIHYLRNSSVNINGLNIWGSPYSNTFGQWAFMKDDEDLATIWDLIPNDTNIVITHGPSYGLGDLVLNHSYCRDPHVGSKSLRAKLLRLPNLKLHVCGHIHEASGIYLGDYVTINASTCDLSYVPFNLPISVNIL